MKQVDYPELLEDAAFGRNGHMHQAGILVLRVGGVVWLRPVTSRGDASSSARLSIPLNAIDDVIAALQEAKNG